MWLINAIYSTHLLFIFNDRPEITPSKTKAMTAKKIGAAAGAPALYIPKRKNPINPAAAETPGLTVTIEPQLSQLTCFLINTHLLILFPQFGH
jgi:hypothetical protein